MNRLNGIQDDLVASLNKVEQQKLEIELLNQDVIELKGNITEMRSTLFDDDSRFYDELADFDKKVSSILSSGCKRKSRTR